MRVAIDLPSGVATDDGAILSPVPDFDLTITFQTLKPSHLLQPAARHMGRIVVADIGIEADSRAARDRPAALSPRRAPTITNIAAAMSPSLAGEMPGASALAAAAAAARPAPAMSACSRRSRSPACRSAVVQGAGAPTCSTTSGSARSRSARASAPATAASALLEPALACEAPLVLDADALTCSPKRDAAAARDDADPHPACRRVRAAVRRR